MGGSVACQCFMTKTCSNLLQLRSINDVMDAPCAPKISITQNVGSLPDPLSA